MQILYGNSTRSLFSETNLNHQYISQRVCNQKNGACAQGRTKKFVMDPHPPDYYCMILNAWNLNGNRVNSDRTPIEFSSLFDLFYLWHYKAFNFLLILEIADNREHFYREFSLRRSHRDSSHQSTHYVRYDTYVLDLMDPIGPNGGSACSSQTLITGLQRRTINLDNCNFSHWFSHTGFQVATFPQRAVIVVCSLVAIQNGRHVFKSVLK